MSPKKLLITLDKPYYLPGDVIRGQVNVDLDTEMDARSIEIDFHAFEYASVSRGSGKHRRTYVERREIAHQKSSLWSCGDEEKTIGPCSESFPFVFSLPNDATPSLYTPFDYPLPIDARERGIKRMIKHYSYSGKITYRLKVKLDKPWAIDPKDKTLIDVLPLPVPEHEKTWLEHESIVPSGEIGIFGSVLGSMFAPGDVIQGKFKILKMEGLEIRSITVSLRFRYSYTAMGHTDTFLQRVDYLTWPDVPGVREILGDFSFIVPQGCPFSVPGTLVRLQWELDIKVDRPMRRDNHLCIPITIGPRG